VFNTSAKSAYFDLKWGFRDSPLLRSLPLPAFWQGRRIVLVCYVLGSFVFVVFVDSGEGLNLALGDGLLFPLLGVARIFSEYFCIDFSDAFAGRCLAVL
jgi:hypothetical protein